MPALQTHLSTTIEHKEELRMTRSTPRIKRIFACSIGALALSAIGAGANAHMCMKKPYGQGYMSPMHPHHPKGYSGPMKRYGYPAPGYRAPAYPEGYGPDADQARQDQQPPAQSSEAAPAGHEPDIIETATAAGDFNTLIKAVVAADLYDTLRGEGPFTLFAPTDAAFAKLPEGTLDELLADKDRLVDVLSYHLVPGRLMAAELLQQREFKTVQGQTLSITDLNVVSADIDTANGIVHVIETVVVPAE
jgi:uncharacterized surface protein with fasciclin (FAS1) repeats